MVGFAAERLVELEVAGLTGAAPGEHSESGINQRNGYRDRDWQTRAGTVELRVPKLRRRAPGPEEGASRRGVRPVFALPCGERAARGARSHRVPHDDADALRVHDRAGHALGWRNPIALDEEGTEGVFAIQTRPGAPLRRRPA